MFRPKFIVRRRKTSKFCNLCLKKLQLEFANLCECFVEQKADREKLDREEQIQS